MFFTYPSSSYLIAFPVINITLGLIVNMVAIYIGKFNYQWYIKVFGVILYLCNLSFSFLLCLFPNYFITELYLKYKHINTDPLALAFCITILMFLSIIYAMAIPLGEFIYTKLKTRTLITSEDSRLKLILKEIKDKAISQGYLHEKHISMRVTSSSDLNAYAYGRNTIIFTTCLLNSLNDEQLKGIIAHELGHLSNNDGIRSLVFIGTMAFPILYYKIISVIYSMLKALAKEFSILNIILLPFTLLMLIITFGVNRISYLLSILMKSFSRRQEFLADKFAVELGYKDQLVMALKSIDNSQFSGLFDLLKNTHPSLEFRLDSMESGYFINKD